MRTIEVKNWTETGIDADGAEKQIEASTIKMVTLLMSSRDTIKLPPGLDNFRLMHRIGKALDKAEKSGKIQLEEGDYAIVKRAIEEDLPPQWGLNPNVVTAVDIFLKAGESEAV